jgi:uncharacterized protein YabN with tetrapyrrole methylase and pyrophosphatase domain
MEIIMEEAGRGPGVALVTYGHPLVFDNVNHTLRKMAIRKGFTVEVQAGISCLDTLCIDLGIEYGNGLLVLEVEDVVDNKIALNPVLETLILQIGNFHTAHTDGHFTPLEKYLRKYYSSSHPATIAFSADRADKPILIKTTISRIDVHRKKIFPGTTLYIPPEYVG